MKAITCYQTADGKRHENLRDAERHAENRFGDAVCKLARDLANLQKYTSTVDYIIAHVAEFAALAELQADAKLNDEAADY